MALCAAFKELWILAFSLDSRKVLAKYIHVQRGVSPPTFTIFSLSAPSQPTFCLPFFCAHLCLPFISKKLAFAEKETKNVLSIHLMVAIETFAY